MAHNTVGAVHALLGVMEVRDWPRLLAAHRPQFAGALAQAERPPERLIDAVVASGDTDLAWHLAGNVELLTARPELCARLCREAVTAAAVVRRIGGELIDAEWLRAFLSIAEAGGPAAVAKALAQVSPPPAVAAALGDPGGLADATAHAEGTAGAIAELRDGITNNLALRGALDWPEVLAAHAERPFRRSALHALAERADCSLDVLFRLGALEQAAARGGDGRIIAEVRPAKAALKALGEQRSERLAALVRDVLGTDLLAWRTLRAELNGFPGTAAELFAAVAARVRGGDVHKGPWPDGGPVPEAGRRPAPSVPRAAFLTLLGAAPVEAHLALLPHLDARTAHDLLTRADPCGEETRSRWTEYVLSGGTRAHRLALADAVWLPETDLRRLLDLGERAVHLRLLHRTAGWRARHAIDCPDWPLQRHILQHTRVRGDIPQLRLLLNHWERHGPGRIRKILDMPYGAWTVVSARVRKRVERLLAKPDKAAALRRLRTIVEEGESAAGQIALVRRRPNRPLFQGDEDWHWDALAAEHRREPFGAWTLSDMAKHPRCPGELRDEGSRVVRRWLSRAEADFAADPDAARVLAAHPVSARDRDWVFRLLRSGHLDWPRLLAYGNPAAAVLDTLACAPATASPDVGYAALSALVAETTDADTWALGMHMLADFEGTLPELLRTAVLATAGAGAP